MINNDYFRCSDKLNDLAKALSLFQGEIKDANKDKQGYGYSYADLSQLLEITRPLLQKHGLSVTQLVAGPGDSSGVITMLLHESGQYIGSMAFFPVERSTGNRKMSLAQEAGCVITYLRRYAYAAILGITQTDNDARVEKEVEVEGKWGSDSPAALAIFNKLATLLEPLPAEDSKKLTDWFHQNGASVEAAQKLINKIEAKLKEKSDGNV